MHALQGIKKIICLLIFFFFVLFSFFSSGVSVHAQTVCSCDYTVIGYDLCRATKNFKLTVGQSYNFRDLTNVSSGVADQPLNARGCSPERPDRRPRPTNLNENVSFTITEDWCDRISLSNDRKMIFTYGTSDYYTTDLVCRVEQQGQDTGTSSEEGSCSCTFGDTDNKGVVPGIKNRGECASLEGKKFERIGETLTECAWRDESISDSTNSTFSVPPSSSLNPLGGTTLQTLIGNVIKTASGVLGSVALVIIIYGGVNFMVRGSSPDQRKKSILTMLWGALGVIVILSSYAILQFVFQGLGIG